MLRDLFNDNNDPGHWKARARRIMLDLDARIDFGLYLTRTWGRELYERYTVFMDRFHTAGWRGWSIVEPVSEGLTLGLGGLVFILALALPALRETSEDDWLKKSELVFFFMQKTAYEIGSRGIRHNDSLKLDEFP